MLCSILERTIVRDGPFDIRGGGGGWDFSCDKLFFSLFLHNKLFFFKSKLQQDFYFFKKNTLKSEKLNESNTLSEKKLKFLFDH